MSRFTERAIEARPGPRCWYLNLQATLSPKQRIELKEALDDPTIPATIIRLVLVEDWKVDPRLVASGSHMVRHRRGECACPR